MRIRSTVPLLLTVLVGCPKSTPTEPLTTTEAMPMAAPAPALAPRPALLVLVVVDQLPVRLLERPAALYEAGLAELTSDDAFVATARYSHAITHTCPGHATISTGVSPSEHSIVANEWYDPADPSEAIYCADASFLKADSLAARVEAAGGSVAALAVKDRAAVMLGGGKAELASWYDREAGTFTAPLTDLDSSGWYQEWTALHPEAYAELVGPDDGPFEGDPGLGKTFPHPAPEPGKLPYTPFAGTALVDAALAAADRLELGADTTPDLLAVSFSQTDYIGHVWTAESWEALDGMVRLDRDLGRLIEGLQARVGDRGLTVLLTSDHGSFETGGVRIPGGAVEAAADAALEGLELPTGVVFESPNVYLPAQVRLDEEARAKAARAVAEAVAAVDGIEGAWAWRDAPVQGPFAEPVTASVHPDRSGDVFVMRAEGALYEYPGSEGTGTSHGTAFSADTDVPFLAWGTGVAPGRATTPVDVRQVPATAAALLGVDPPADSDAEPVTAAIQR